MLATRSTTKSRFAFSGLVFFALLIIGCLYTLGYLPDSHLLEKARPETTGKPVSAVKAETVVLQADLMENSMKQEDIEATPNVYANQNVVHLYHLRKNPQGTYLPSPKQPVSIVIVNFQEEFLVRTVHSIFEATSSELINEILIVDDKSEPPVEFEHFKDAKNPICDPRIRILRAHERLGLIRARVAGGDSAQGPIMILVDAHVRPHDEWLRPIVKLMDEDHKQILLMENGILDATTWKQKDLGAIGAKASFHNDLVHFWQNDHSLSELQKLSGDANVDIQESPITMGMFAISKQWWRTIEGMDDGLQLWGGENIEISLRTWLCGGRIRVARGSGIDHLFRDKAHYEKSSDKYSLNLMRIAKAWLDEEHRANFFKLTGHNPNTDVGNFDKILELKKKLQCKDFSWYAKKFNGRALTPRDK